MKKKVIVTSVVGMMLVSNMAFAGGFGLPSIGGTLGGDKKTESKTNAKPLDLTDVTKKQTDLLQTMNAAMVLAAMAHTEIGLALGQTDSDMIATTNIMQKNLTTDKKSADKVKKQLKNYTPQQFDAIAVKGTEEQKATLKKAMEKASNYKNISNVLFVAAVAQAPGVLKEASGMLKNANFNQMGQLNGIVSTCKQVGSLNSATQSYFGGYSKNSANARALLKPSEIKPSDASLKSLATAAKEGNFSF